MADTTNNPRAERTADTAETPQLVVAVTTLFGDEECAPPAKKSRTLFAHSSPERSCGVMAGRGPLYPSMDTDETPQLAVALTHDLCDEEFLCAMGWRKLERAEHTAETPQVVVASTPHLVGGNCASDAAGVTATSARSYELADGQGCAPSPMGKCAVVALSPTGRACGPVAGRAPFSGAAPVIFRDDELTPPCWRGLVHAIRLASAPGEYGKFVMDHLKLLRSLPAASQGRQVQIETAECEVGPEGSFWYPEKAHAPCVFVR